MITRSLKPLYLFFQSRLYQDREEYDNKVVTVSGAGMVVAHVVNYLL